MSAKAIIREAEEQIEEILQTLQDEHGIRPFRIQIDSPDEEDEIEVTLIKNTNWRKY